MKQDLLLAPMPVLTANSFSTRSRLENGGIQHAPDGLMAQKWCRNLSRGSHGGPGNRSPHFSYENGPNLVRHVAGVAARVVPKETKQGEEPLCFPSGEFAWPVPELHHFCTARRFAVVQNSSGNLRPSTASQISSPHDDRSDAAWVHRCGSTRSIERWNSLRVLAGSQCSCEDAAVQ